MKTPEPILFFRLYLLCLLVLIIAAALVARSEREYRAELQRAIQRSQRENAGIREIDGHPAFTF